MARAAVHEERNRGTVAGVASSRSSLSSQASATLPMPIALRAKNCRRVAGANVSIIFNIPASRQRELAGASFLFFAGRLRRAVRRGG
jgi:hypothetical protein